jgi:hypothetical protein
MPKWLVIAAIIGVILIVVVMSWLNRRSLEPSGPSSANAPVASAPASPVKAPAQRQAAPPPAAPQQGPVVLTATAPAWIQVTDQGKTLFQGELQPGQSYSVPPGATAPLLKAGKPEALKVTVGSAVAPPVGPPGKVASKVSLKGPDLMRGGSLSPQPTPQPGTNAAGQ